MIYYSINREIPNLSKKLNANDNPQKKKQKAESKTLYINNESESVLFSPSHHRQWQ